jgi:hypothetical protein
MEFGWHIWGEGVVAADGISLDDEDGGRWLVGFGHGVFDFPFHIGREMNEMAREMGTRVGGMGKVYLMRAENDKGLGC